MYVVHRPSGSVQFGPPFVNLLQLSLRLTQNVVECQAAFFPGDLTLPLPITPLTTETLRLHQR